MKIEDRVACRLQVGLRIKRLETRRLIRRDLIEVYEIFRGIGIRILAVKLQQKSVRPKLDIGSLNILSTKGLSMGENEMH